MREGERRRGKEEGKDRAEKRWEGQRERKEGRGREGERGRCKDKGGRKRRERKGERGKEGRGGAFDESENLHSPFFSSSFFKRI